VTTPQLTTLEADGWMIDDGEIAHAESPDKFWIPSLRERQALEPGSIVKIRFYIRVPNDTGELVDHGERMWVQVKERHGDWYFGALDNDPYCTDWIQAGMPLWFQPRHVIDIDRG
jgi:hypothetical protein